jgi:hypothetical protein
MPHPFKGDAWRNFLTSWNEFQEHESSAQTMETQRQVLLDETPKEQTDPALLQKMLKEWI